MKHTIDRIEANPQDYKFCRANSPLDGQCDTINWYENTACRFCNSENEFQSATQKMLTEEIEAYIAGFEEEHVDETKIKLEV